MMKFEDAVSLFFSDQNAPNLFKSEIDKLEREQVKIAVIGRSGTGKSSLINALYGEKVAQTGVVETTDGPQEFNIGGLVIVDLPGCGTSRYPLATYVEDLDLAKYDVFIHVVAKRIYEDDLQLLKKLETELQKDVHIVRSMIDQDLTNARRDGQDPDETEAQIRADLEHHFQDHPRIWLVSSIFPEKFDFPAFEESIYNQLSEHKRDKFVVAAQAYTNAQLEKKRKVARRHVILFSGLAAANGFNPIPGTSIAADIAIIAQMNQWILKCYKLDERTLSSFYDKDEGAAFKKTVGNVIALGTKDVIIATMKHQLGKMTRKEIARWVPVVGNVTAAGLGFAYVSWMGHDLIDKAEKVVSDLILSRV